MKTAADRFDEVRAQAESLGYRVRRRWLDGCGGGEVLTAGKRWIFVDDMQSPQAQVEAVVGVLRKENRASLDRRRAA